MKKTLAVFLAVLMLFSLAPSVLAGGKTMVSSLLTDGAKTLAGGQKVFEEIDISSLTTLEPGTYVFTGISSSGNEKAITNTENKYQYMDTVAVKSTDGKLVTDDETVMWEVETVGDGFAIKSYKEDKYLAANPSVAATYHDSSESSQAQWQIYSKVLKTVDNSAYIVAYYGSPYITFSDSMVTASNVIHVYKFTGEEQGGEGPGEEPGETDKMTFEKVELSGLTTLEPGTYIFANAAGTKAFANTDHQSNYMANGAVTVEDDKIVTDDETIMWNVETVGNGFSLQSYADATRYLTCNGTNTPTYSTTSASAQAQFQIYNGLALKTVGEDAVSYIVFYYSNPYVAGGTSLVSESNAVRAYKLVEEEEPTVPTFEKVELSGLTTLEPGTYIFANAAGTKAFANTDHQSNYMANAAVTVEDDKIVTDNETIMWNVETVGNGFSLQSYADATRYLTCNGTNTPTYSTTSESAQAQFQIYNGLALKTVGEDAAAYIVFYYSNPYVAGGTSLVSESNAVRAYKLVEEDEGGDTPVVPGEGKEYEKVADTANLEEGYYVITDANSTKAVSSDLYAAGTSAFTTAVDVTDIEGKITTDNDSIVWKLEKVGSNFALKSVDEGKYLVKAVAAGIFLDFAEDSTDKSAQWYLNQGMMMNDGSGSYLPLVLDSTGKYFMLNDGLPSGGAAANALNFYKCTEEDTEGPGEGDDPTTNTMFVQVTDEFNNNIVFEDTRYLFTLNVNGEYKALKNDGTVLDLVTVTEEYDGQQRLVVKDKVADADAWRFAKTANSSPASVRYTIKTVDGTKSLNLTASGISLSESEILFQPMKDGSTNVLATTTNPPYGLAYSNGFVSWNAYTQDFTCNTVLFKEVAVEEEGGEEPTPGDVAFEKYEAVGKATLRPGTYVIVNTNDEKAFSTTYTANRMCSGTEVDTSNGKVTTTDNTIQWVVEAMGKNTFSLKNVDKDQYLTINNMQFAWQSTPAEWSLKNGQLVNGGTHIAAPTTFQTYAAAAAANYGALNFYRLPVEDEPEIPEYIEDAFVEAPVPVNGMTVLFGAVEKEGQVELLTKVTKSGVEGFTAVSATMTTGDELNEDFRHVVLENDSKYFGVYWTVSDYNAEDGTFTLTNAQDPECVFENLTMDGLVYADGMFKLAEATKDATEYVMFQWMGTEDVELPEEPKVEYVFEDITFDASLKLEPGAYLVVGRNSQSTTAQVMSSVPTGASPNGLSQVAKARVYDGSKYSVTLTEDDADLWWIIDEAGDGYFYMQHYLTEGYVASTAAARTGDLTLVSKLDNNAMWKLSNTNGLINNREFGTNMCNYGNAFRSFNNTTGLYLYKLVDGQELPQKPQTFHEVEFSADDFASGTYVITYNSNNVYLAMTDTVFQYDNSNKALAVSAVTVDTDEAGKYVTNPEDSVVAKIMKGSDGLYTISFANGQYLKYIDQYTASMTDSEEDATRFSVENVKGVTAFVFSIGTNGYALTYGTTTISGDLRQGFKTVWTGFYTPLAYTLFKLDNEVVEEPEPEEPPVVEPDAPELGSKLEPGTYIFAAADQFGDYYTMDASTFYEAGSYNCFWHPAVTIEGDVVKNATETMLWEVDTVDVNGTVTYTLKNVGKNQYLAMKDGKMWFVDSADEDGYVTTWAIQKMENLNRYTFVAYNENGVAEKGYFFFSKGQSNFYPWNAPTADFKLEVYTEYEEVPFVPEEGDYVLTEELENGVYVLAGLNAQQEYLAMDATTVTAGALVSQKVGVDAKKGLITDELNDNLKWAVVKEDEGYLLFNIGMNKYLAVEGDELVLADAPYYWTYTDGTFKSAARDVNVYLTLTDANTFALTSTAKELAFFLGTEVEVPELPKPEAPAPEASDFKQVEFNDQLADGTYVFTSKRGNDYVAMTNVVDFGMVMKRSEAIDVQDEYIMGEVAADVQWVVTKVDNGYTLYNEDAGYLAADGTKLKLSATEYTWTLENVDGTYAFKANNSSGNCYLCYGSAGDYFWLFSKSEVSETFLFTNAEENEPDPVEPKDGDFVLTQDIEDGVYVIAGLNNEVWGGMLNTGSGFSMNYSALEVKDNIVTSEVGENLQWVIVKDNNSDGYVIYNQQIDKYLAATSTWSFELTDTAVVWNIKKADNNAVQLTCDPGTGINLYLNFNGFSFALGRNESVVVYLYKAYNVEAPELPGAGTDPDEPNVGDFVLVDELEEGTYVIAALKGDTYNAMTNDCFSGVLNPANIEVADNKVTSDVDETLKWVVAKEGNGYSLYNEAKDQYLEAVLLYGSYMVQYSSTPYAWTYELVNNKIALKVTDGQYLTFSTLFENFVVDRSAGTLYFFKEVEGEKPVVPVTYHELTYGDDLEIETGTYIVAFTSNGTTYAMSNVLSDNKLVGDEITVLNDEDGNYVVDPAENLVWKIRKNYDGKYFVFEDKDGMYLEASGYTLSLADEHTTQWIQYGEKTGASFLFNSYMALQYNGNFDSNSIYTKSNYALRLFKIDSDDTATDLPEPVQPPKYDVSYHEVTSYRDLSSGTYVVAYNNNGTYYAMSNVVNGNAMKQYEVTVLTDDNGSFVADPAEELVWKIRKNYDGSFYVFQDKDDKYLDYIDYAKLALNAELTDLAHWSANGAASYVSFTTDAVAGGYMAIQYNEGVFGVKSTWMQSNNQMRLFKIDENDDVTDLPEPEVEDPHALGETIEDGIYTFVYHDTTMGVERALSNVYVPSRLGSSAPAYMSHKPVEINENDEIVDGTNVRWEIKKLDGLVYDRVAYTIRDVDATDEYEYLAANANGITLANGVSSNGTVSTWSLTKVGDYYTFEANGITGGTGGTTLTYNTTGRYFVVDTKTNVEKNGVQIFVYNKYYEEPTGSDYEMVNLEADMMLNGNYVITNGSLKAMNNTLGKGGPSNSWNGFQTNDVESVVVDGKTVLKVDPANELLWEIKPIEEDGYDGYFYVKNVATGKYLNDDNYGAAFSDTIVNTAAWKVRSFGSGFVFVSKAASNKNLTFNNGVFTVLKDASTTGNLVLFGITTEVGPEPTPDVPVLPENHYFVRKSIQKGFMEAGDLSGEYVIAQADNWALNNEVKTEKVTPVAMTSYDEEGNVVNNTVLSDAPSTAIIWVITRVDGTDADYTIQNKFTGEYLSYDGTNVVTAKEAYNWTLRTKSYTDTAPYFFQPSTKVGSYLSIDASGNVSVTTGTPRTYYFYYEVELNTEAPTPAPTETPEDATFVAWNYAENMTDGTYVVTATLNDVYRAMGNVLTGALAFNSNEVKVEDDKVVTNDRSLEWKFTAVNGGYNIYNVGLGKYLGTQGAGMMYLAETISATSPGAVWSLVENNGFTSFGVDGYFLTLNDANEFVLVKELTKSLALFISEDEVPVATETPDVTTTEPVQTEEPTGDLNFKQAAFGSELEPDKYVITYTEEGVSNRVMALSSKVKNVSAYYKTNSAVEVNPVNGIVTLPSDSALIWTLEEAPKELIDKLNDEKGTDVEVGYLLKGSDGKYLKGDNGFLLMRDGATYESVWTVENYTADSVTFNGFWYWTSATAQGWLAPTASYDDAFGTDWRATELTLYRYTTDVVETVAPTETPDVSETPDPTETVEPTETPDVSETPNPTETIEPTETPDVTETPDPSETPDVNTYTVTFVDWDGKVLAEVEVAEGEAAQAPEAEFARENWIFAGWDADFTEVTEDMTVKAVYYKVGDVNLNGTIEAGDATLVLREVVGSGEAPLTELQLLIADVNRTETVDAGDATKILRHAVGTEVIDYGPEAPAEGNPGNDDDEETEGEE